MDPTGLGAEVFKQIPAVAAIIYVVVIFLKHLAKRDEGFAQITKEWSENQRQIVKDHGEHFERVIERNNLVIEHISGVITNCNAKLVQMSQVNRSDIPSSG